MTVALVPPSEEPEAPDRVRRRKTRIRVATAFTGVGSFAATLTGIQPFSLFALGVSIAVGITAAAPVILVEEIFTEFASARRGRADLVREPTAAPPGPVSPPPRSSAPASAAPVVEPPEPGPTSPYPKSSSTFRGRTRELTDLRQVHDRERRSRLANPAPPGSAGPVVLALYGLPGVGKTALAQEFCNQVAANYGGGFLYANFGTGGGARPASEILKGFLLELGWDEDEMPADATDRANLLRTLTANRQMLFLFDAARHPDQVLQVMPSGAGCTVGITSRRDMTALNPAYTQRLQVPTVEEALDILAATARLDWVADAEAATEIVQMCGRLPLAIRSAAERITLDGTHLRHVADLLRPRHTRLGWLQRAGRGVRERIESEYRRVSQQQRDALCLLSTVDTATFVSWVLAPLMDVALWEADNIVASLVAAQLLDEADRDQATDLPRYRFNPLVRLFAEQERSTMDPEVITQANARLDQAMVELVDDILAEIPDGYRRRRSGPRQWLPPDSPIHARIARRPDHGVRTEYQNLVRVIRATELEPALRWRVAAWLRSCVPDGVVHAHSLEAFGRGRLAAIADATELGLIDVQLARASFLIAVEDYAPAFELLRWAGVHALQMRFARGGELAVPAGIREVQAHRKRAEAYLQMGAFRDASAALAEAARLVRVPQLAQTPAGAEELREIRLLQAENHGVPGPDPSYPDLLDGRLGDAVFFRAHLGLSEAARRRGYWDDAQSHLHDAEQHSAGDARRAATVHYRLARLYIDQWRHTTPHLGITQWAEDVGVVPETGPAPEEIARHRDLALRAVSHAAQAVVAFRDMSNRIGLVRAQCQHVRALVVAGRLVEAEQLCHAVWQYLAEAVPDEMSSWGPLLARFARASGELMLHRGMFESAWRKLSHAATLYAGHDDWTAYAEVWQLLNELNRNYTYPTGSAFENIDDVLDIAVASALPTTPRPGSGSVSDAIWPPLRPRDDDDDDEPDGA